MVRISYGFDSHIQHHIILRLFMYQLHYTINTHKHSIRTLPTSVTDHHKVIEHYNISNERKYYELLTSKNFENLPTISTLPVETIRVKLETTIKPSNFLYVEKHYKLNYEPDIPNNKFIMLTEVINPPFLGHTHILTIRATTLEQLEELESLVSINPTKTTTEYCIFDTNEQLDYL